MISKGKVVLIQPKNTLAMNIYPPLNLIKVGSALESHGYETTIVASPLLEAKEAKDVLLNECRDAFMVGIGILTTEVPDAIELARFVKEQYDLPIVWGGWHTTLFPEQMAESTLVDKVIVDEGDELIIRAAEHYSRPNWRDDDREKIWRNENKLNLDLCPIPNYSLVPDIEYFINTPLADKFFEYDEREIRWLPYEATRGCPSRCSFCIINVTDNNQYRKRTATRVVDEIETIVNRHKINHLKIVDDNFFVNKHWVREFATELGQRQLDMTWDAECRVNYFNKKHVNDELLSLCVKSGLNELNFGVESGSQRSLDLMKKGQKPEQALDAVRTASEYGIVARCSFIIDAPGERKEDILMTTRLISEIRKIPRTTCGVHTFRPYPGSELCDEMLKNGTIKQPSSFEGWADEEVIGQFTYADAKRKWQKNYHISNKISFYQCLESGFFLRPHQIKSKFVRAVNNSFMGIARWRNENSIYYLCIDRPLYVFFKKLYYKTKQENRNNSLIKYATTYFAFNNERTKTS
jgi:anaerobic magnesium-protoporphyrin IX monomethyl ester cyclase